MLAGSLWSWVFPINKSLWTSSYTLFCAGIASLSLATVMWVVDYQKIRRGTKLFGMVIVTISVSLILQNGLLAIWGPSFFSYRMSAGHSYHLGSMVFTSSHGVSCVGG